MTSRLRPLSLVGAAGGLTLLALLLVPLAALALTSSPSALAAGLAHPMFLPALGLSLRTTAISLVLTVSLGSPLAWWLGRSTSGLARAVEAAVELPIVVPPAVMGVALLSTFGRQGLLGPALASVGVGVPFTEGAVVLAQVVVSAPFYVRAAASAFRRLDPEMIVVARSLGATPAEAMARVVVPCALPGVVVAASLAWARALGEFGATLLFAGNLTGRTQTLPLAIFTALESDVQLAVVFSLVLAAVGGLLLLSLRGLPSLRAAWGQR